MSDDYETDVWLKEGLFNGWYDPCPLNPDWDEDGLMKMWENYTFINPPYSNPLPWVLEAIEQRNCHGYTIALLLKHDSSTRWYKALHEAGAHFLMVGGRLKHRTGKSAAFPSVIAILEAFEE